jgi:hypothetical protein
MPSTWIIVDLIILRRNLNHNFTNSQEYYYLSILSAHTKDGGYTNSPIGREWRLNQNAPRSTSQRPTTAFSRSFVCSVETMFIFSDDQHSHPRSGGTLAGLAGAPPNTLISPRQV